MGSIDLRSVRSCWGNSNFDYVHSDSVGNSGGILCIWDPNSFRRSNFYVIDYFCHCSSVWLKSDYSMNSGLYAPQKAKEKRMLWDYLAHVSNQWVGKLVMMGDFNEVKYKSDRYGSNFNAHDAEIFNSFIYNAGLDEVHLEESYTWSNSRGEIYFLKEELRSCDELLIRILARMRWSYITYGDSQQESSSLYKIIAKILANRLVGVLGDLVNEVQSAFVADRQILDGPFILDEVLQWCRRKKKHALIFKVDFREPLILSPGFRG
ncbi:RNA-directed DNA polymerase, eukaryota [Tanacetum coccineum]